MMRSVFLDVQLPFETKGQAAVSEDTLLWFLGVTARLNLNYLRQHPRTPKLYSKQAGIAWCPPDQMEGAWLPDGQIQGAISDLLGRGMAPEKAEIIRRLIEGAEIFQDIPTLFKIKRGDCDRLVSARLAELWFAGIIASPLLVPFKNETKGTTYHAVVAHADDTVEDPSLILGMGGEARAADRAEEIRKNRRRHDALVAAAYETMIIDGASIEALGSIIDRAAYVPRGGFA